MNVEVSAVLIIAFSIVVVGMVIQFGNPLVEEHRQELDFEQGKSLVNFISIIVSDLISEPLNSSRELKLELKKGYLSFSDNQVSFSTGIYTHTKNFNNIFFNDIELPEGNINLKLTKVGINNIRVELN